MSFTYCRELRLKDTDATGVLYFVQQFQFAMETFEEFLKDRGFSWKELMASSFLLPVVHAEADYSASVTVGDTLQISLQVARLGTSSIALHYSFTDPQRQIEVGKADIVHVVVDKAARTSVPIPDFLRAILETGIALEMKG